MATSAACALTATGHDSPAISTTGVNSALSTSSGNCRIDNATDGRPPPRPVVPGAHEVPAAEISRAKSSSGALSACVTATRSTAWRGGWAVACGP
ncbi:hypothetical protein D3C72_1339740 [compost metagenome]